MPVPDPAYVRCGRVLVRASFAPVFPIVDTVVFDVDGVLLDVRGSFREAVVRTVQRSVGAALGTAPRLRYLRRSDVALFKRAGGFNNDWELAEAATLFFLWKHEMTGAAAPDALRESPPSLAEALERATALGGGLPAFETALAAAAPGAEEALARARRRVDPARIRSVFVDVYAGRNAPAMYPGYTGPTPRERGLAEGERVLLDESLLDGARYRYGILTGRNEGELAFALGRMPRLRALLTAGVRVDDGGPLKPAAEALLPLVAGAEAAVYVGDTADDLQTALNARRALADAGDRTPILFAAVAHTTADRAFFAARGADMITRSVNDVLSFLDSVHLGSRP